MKQQYESLEIKDINNKLDKLHPRDVLYFANKMSDYLLNYREVNIFVNDVRKVKDKKNDLMISFFVDYQIFAKSRVKKSYDFTYDNSKHTFVNYRSKDFGCSNINTFKRDEPITEGYSIVKVK